MSETGHRTLSVGDTIQHVGTQAMKTITPIDQAATELSNCIADLEQSLNDLYVKIKPILGPERPLPGGDGTPEYDEGSTLLKYFRNETDSINRLASLVRGVSERVEC